MAFFKSNFHPAPDKARGILIAAVIVATILFVWGATVYIGIDPISYTPD